MADSIAYDAHDIDDAIKLGLFSLEELYDLDIMRLVRDRVHNRFPDLPAAYQRQALVHQLIDHLVTSVLRQSEAFFVTCGWTDTQQATHVDAVIQPAADVDHQKRLLEKFLYQRVYRHPDLLIVRQRAQEKVTRMVHFFAEQTGRLPKDYRDRADDQGTLRAAAEYVAGMTDRFCEQTFAELFA